MRNRLLLCVLCASVAFLPAQTKYAPLPDEKGVVAEAEKKLAADPKNVDLLVALAQAQASVWRFDDAITSYTRAIELAPENAALYRDRGHRYVTTRQFEKALADLERGARLNDRDYGIWYHLGLTHYLLGGFDQGAAAYERCRELTLTDENFAAVSDWLYMSYRRAGKDRAAAWVLEQIRPGMKVKENNSYYNRLLLYKGLKKESELLNEKSTDLEVATVGYGIGNWRLYNGNKAKAREYFERVVSGKYWPAFGFIAAEVELKRTR